MEISDANVFVFLFKTIDCRCILPFSRSPFLCITFPVMLISENIILVLMKWYSSVWSENDVCQGLVIITAIIVGELKISTSWEPMSISQSCPVETQQTWNRIENKQLLWIVTVKRNRFFHCSHFMNNFLEKPGLADVNRTPHYVITSSFELAGCNTIHHRDYWQTYHYTLVPLSIWKNLCAYLLES